MQPTEDISWKRSLAAHGLARLGKALAPRELEALLWVAQGLTTKEIAREMAVSPGTVANRIEAALFKLEAGRRIEAVTKAMRQQIISPLCIALAGLIAMHAVIGDSDPMRRDRRVPERRTAQVRIVRKAEAFEAPRLTHPRINHADNNAPGLPREGGHAQGASGAHPGGP